MQLAQYRLQWRNSVKIASNNQAQLIQEFIDRMNNI
jgi:hypothetical protein